MSRLPDLSAESSLRVSRQGGLAGMPGLARPRQIEMSQFDVEQRDQICAVLEHCLALASDDAGAGDRRFYRVELHFKRENADEELVLQVPEERAPEGLVHLWQSGTTQRS